jgi:site-specific recombinase XerD
MKHSPSDLQQALESRVRLLATTLRPATVQQYRHTVRVFLRYLTASFPEVTRPDQLRRDPHILGWLEHLWMYRVKASGRALCKHSRAAHLIHLRKLLDLLADHRYAPRAALLLDDDIPKPDQLLPRPLSPQDDERLLSQLRSLQHDPLSSALLLTRLTGLRIGEIVDLASDCLHRLAGAEEQWALHVPLGKLHTERWTPVDQEVRDLVARLRFLSSLAPGTGGREFLLNRPKGRSALIAQLRAVLRQNAAVAGITSHVVPHQLRHTFATTMLRAGVSLPALMKLLGHRSANMTLHYVEITQKDLQREFHLARENPRYLIPLPAPLDTHSPIAAGAGAISQALSNLVRALELFRAQATAEQNKPLILLLRRIIRSRALFQKLISVTKT